MSYEKDNAIAIWHQDFSETSRVLTFFTRRHGRVTTLAKGVKRKYSRMIGHVDLLSHAEIVFVSGRFRDRMNILTDAALAESFWRIRRELSRYYAACHAAELVYAMTAEEDPSPELFEQLLALLRRLEAGVEPGVALFAFEAHLLTLTGFMPEVSRCVACGKKPRLKRVAFSPLLGGIVCGECAHEDPELMANVSAGGLSLLGSLAERKLTKVDRIRLSPRMAKQMRTFLNGYERYVLGRDLRTLRHL